MSRDVPQHARRLHQLANQLQVFAGLIARGAPGVDLLERFQTLLDLASDCTHGERLVAERLLSDAFDKLRVAIGLSAYAPFQPSLSLNALQREMAAARQLSSAPESRHVLTFFKTLHDRHAHVTLRLPDLASEIGLSVSYLSRLIRRATGYGFEWHLRRLRIHHAEQLLATTDLSVKEVAAASGFSSASSFDRQFKAVMGLQPTLYRARRVGLIGDFTNNKDVRHSR